jgi:hypothetical protein
VKLLATAAARPEELYPKGPNSREFAAHGEPARRDADPKLHERASRRGRSAVPALKGSTRTHDRTVRTPRRRIPKETPVQKFKAYRTFQENDTVQSRFVEMTLDELDPGDVVVRTKYSTINFKDALSYNGAGKIMRKYPTNAGIDMAGTVETSADTRWKRGDKVIVMRTTSA